MRKQYSQLIIKLSILVVLAINSIGKVKAQKSNIFQIVEGDFSGKIIDGYMFHLPINLDKKKSYPLLFSLSGGGSVGGKVEVLTNWGIPKKIANQKENTPLLNSYLLDSFIVVAPHMKEGEFKERQWYNQEDAFIQIVEELDSKFDIDRDRIYVTGLSRGGHGTWGIASRLEIFAAAIPICGGLHGIEAYEILSQVPIWVTYNSGDGSVSSKKTRAVLTKIEQESGASFHKMKGVTFTNMNEIEKDRILTIFHKDGHNAWDETYASPDVFKWLLSKRKDRL